VCFGSSYPPSMFMFDVVDLQEGWTALMYNARYGNSVDVSRVLIDAGSDVNGKSSVSVFDVVCCVSAAQEGHDAVMGVLLAAGSDVDAKNNVSVVECDPWIVGHLSLLTDWLYSLDVGCSIPWHSLNNWCVD